MFPQLHEEHFYCWPIKVSTSQWGIGKSRIQYRETMSPWGVSISATIAKQEFIIHMESRVSLARWFCELAAGSFGNDGRNFKALVTLRSFTKPPPSIHHTMANYTLSWSKLLSCNTNKKRPGSVIPRAEFVAAFDVTSLEAIKFTWTTSAEHVDKSFGTSWGVPVESGQDKGEINGWKSQHVIILWADGQFEGLKKYRIFLLFNIQKWPEGMEYVPPLLWVYHYIQVQQEVKEKPILVSNKF